MKIVTRIMIPCVLAVTAAVFVMAGLTFALPKYNKPTQYHLTLRGEHVDGYIVRVLGTHAADFRVGADGRVILDVPRLPRRCSVDWFGIRVWDGSPMSRKVVEVLKDGRILRRLSLQELERLPIDSVGDFRIDL
jgi:hypothetical protein